MKVRVLYFAGVRDLRGCAEETVDVPEEVRTIAALVRWLEGHAPALAGRLSSVRVARNESFADAADAIAENDEIALIPPVAGGA